MAEKTKKKSAVKMERTGQRWYTTDEFGDKVFLRPDQQPKDYRTPPVPLRDMPAIPSPDDLLVSLAQREALASMGGPAAPAPTMRMPTAPPLLDPATLALDTAPPPPPPPRATTQAAAPKPAAKPKAKAKATSKAKAKPVAPPAAPPATPEPGLMGRIFSWLAHGGESPIELKLPEDSGFPQVNWGNVATPKRTFAGSVEPGSAADRAVRQGGTPGWMPPGNLAGHVLGPPSPLGAVSPNGPAVRSWESQVAAPYVGPPRAQAALDQAAAMSAPYEEPTDIAWPVSARMAGATIPGAPLPPPPVAPLGGDYDAYLEEQDLRDMPIAAAEEPAIPAPPAANPVAANPAPANPMAGGGPTDLLLPAVLRQLNLLRRGYGAQANAMNKAGARRARMYGIPAQYQSPEALRFQDMQYAALQNPQASPVQLAALLGEQAAQFHPELQQLQRQKAAMAAMGASNTPDALASLVGETLDMQSLRDQGASYQQRLAAAQAADAAYKQGLVGTEQTKAQAMARQNEVNLELGQGQNEIARMEAQARANAQGIVGQEAQQRLTMVQDVVRRLRSGEYVSPAERAMVMPQGVQDPETVLAGQRAALTGSAMEALAASGIVPDAENVGAVVNSLLPPVPTATMAPGAPLPGVPAPGAVGNSPTAASVPISAADRKIVADAGTARAAYKALRLRGYDDERAKQIVTQLFPRDEVGDPESWDRTWSEYVDTVPGLGHALRKFGIIGAGLYGEGQGRASQNRIRYGGAE